MASPRFFVGSGLRPDSALRLDTSSAHHAARVLRLSVGAAVTVFDGTGGEYEGRLASVDRHGVTVEVGAFSGVERESPLDVTLVQALCSGDRMDVALQKSVELGVARIQPVSSERSVVKLAGERVEKRESHWRGVVQSACEQCGRNRIPAVDPLMPLSTWLAQAPADALRLLLSPLASERLSELPRPTGRIVLLAGPEGGFTPAEHALATTLGFQPVRLGARVLRTETAAMAALAALQTLWGDF